MSELLEKYYKRSTKETAVEVALCKSEGSSQVDTGIGFFDHMLLTFLKYSHLSGSIHVKGDLSVDGHHTIEDVGLSLGRVINLIVGDEAISRYGQVLMPMDEALVRVVLDLGGRPFLDFDYDFKSDVLGKYETQMTEEFLRAFAMQVLGTLHVDVLKGKNDHHITEAIFKGLGVVFREAMMNRNDGILYSTKGRVVEVYDRCSEL